MPKAPDARDQTESQKKKSRVSMSKYQGFKKRSYSHVARIKQIQEYSIVITETITASATNPAEMRLCRPSGIIPKVCLAPRI